MTHEEILSMLGDYVDYLIANSSADAPMWNIEKVRSGKPNKWNYIDGCMITACLSLYKTTGDEKYLSFSRDFIDYFVQPDGSIKTYDPKEYNLDNVNQGKNLFTLYDIFGDEKYRRAIDTIRSQLLTQPRTKEGNFWHKDIYPWQVWLDGTYMAQPFYMEPESRDNKNAYHHVLYLGERIERIDYRLLRLDALYQAVGGDIGFFGARIN